MRRLLLSVFIPGAMLCAAVFSSSAQAQPKDFQFSTISGGARANKLAPRIGDLYNLQGAPDHGITGLSSFSPGVSFLAYNFDNNATENGGYLFIPPDPCGAAGTDRVLAVVNAGIECRNKTGALIFRDSLHDFFSALGGATLGTFCFDPKVVYDHYEDRFLVVALEQTAVAAGDPSDDSRILVAVSKTSSPATATSSDWWYLAINSKTNIGGFDHWADYPGFEIDEEAVYITANMFPFSSGSGGVRLWIIDKGVAGGFYAGSSASWNIYNPIPGGFFNVTCQPALVFGAGGVAPGVGTFLVGYNSLTYGGPGQPEAVQIIRIDNPLSSPTFTGEFVIVADIENVGGAYGFPAIPDAPQSGTATLIAVNDSRAMDAVWRNNSLWFTATINPNTAYDATNNGQATAHWFRIDTSAIPSPLTLADEGDIGGEDIASNTWTFFPSVAVNQNDAAKFGFAASASSIYAGAYYAGREAGDAAGTVQASGTVKAGVDYYQRTFGGAENRWGDYTGAAVDPSDDTTFWIFNQYANTRGTGTAPEDGRWGTAWASCTQVLPPTEDFGDCPDPGYQTLLASNGARHTIVPGVFMGTLIDAEPDGQPNFNATLDDATGSYDEDGVSFPASFVPGSPTQINVTTSVPGWLDVWVDFDLDGTFTPADLVWSNAAGPGVNIVNFSVPVTALSGPTFMRVRFNTTGPLTPVGPAADGEVEDYQILVEDPYLDFGDAPDPSYPTLLVNDGARHDNTVPGAYMGALIDAESDGQPNAAATGDDLASLADEDGVAFVSGLYPGTVAQIDVTVSMNGWLDAWIDFNQDGIWGAGEQIFSGNVLAGVNNLTPAIPGGALLGNTYARFRYNSGGVALNPTGYAPDGEVEDYQVLIEEEPVPTEDFGDCPDPTFKTLLASNGPRHTVVPGILLGAQIDAELDGQPDPGALGDDSNNLADEDGVLFATSFVPGSPAQIDVFPSVAGWVDIWADFDMDGAFTPADLLFSGAVVPGPNSLGVSVPVYAVPGANVFLRVRFNTAGALGPDGPAADGEVEDYVVIVEEPTDIDFGDAPDLPYPTLLLNNGARHAIVPGVFMGNLIDGEPDGQPDATATGDDLANLADEDGVVFVTALAQGTTAQIDVTVSVGGWLDAWIDYDQNGVWDPGEKIYSGPVTAGLNSLGPSIPTGIPVGNTFSRFRYNINGVVLNPTGYASDGEVEDYMVAIEPEPEPTEDFGDAPDPTYQTLLASGGPSHTVVAGVFMGALIDAELDGQPDPTATGDDLANLADEDGVVFVTPIVPGQPLQMDVTVSVAGFLDVWIDHDLDGMFTAGDQVFSGPVGPGLNSIFYSIPGLAATGPSFARIRYNTTGPLPPTGPAPDGEVEDYAVTIEEPPTDFGDAPDGPYPTLSASNGASHVIVPGVYMGALIDAEGDGQPNATATGDDVAGSADEDGLAFITPLTVGGNPQINVTVSQDGWLDLWIDYDQNGTWSAGEHVYSAAVSAGLNYVMFTIPGGTPTGTTYLRARYNLTGALNPDGPAGDGEVEDYEVEITSVTGVPDDLGHRFHMAPAAPNPFVRATTVNYAIPEPQRVKLQVFTLDGRLAATLVDEQLPAGPHVAEWNGLDDRGRPMPSGVYFFRLLAGPKAQTQRVIYIR